MANKESFRTMIGGQAIIEGIMMRGPDKAAIVVRTPDGLQTKEETLTFLKDRYPIVGWPLVRGVVNFVSSMRVGMKALTWSAEFFEEEETPTDKEPSKFSAWLDTKLSSEKAQSILMTVTMALGIALAVGLFILFPTWLVSLLDPSGMSRTVQTLLEGLARLLVLLGYMLLVSRMKEIQRVFSYHGAEHKTIACYEAGEELTVDNVRHHSRFHPRCGTSFLLTVVVVSVLVFSVAVPFEGIWLRLGSRLLLLPVVVAISYEINRYIGKHDHLLSRIVRTPGLWMQKITTHEPDDNMIEVGIHALSLVIPARTGADDWDTN